VKWHEHVQRHSELVINPLAEWRGKVWLQQRRQQLLPMLPRGISNMSILAGRTGTRVTVGAVHRRWHDGYDYAQESLATESCFMQLIGLQLFLNMQLFNTVLIFGQLYCVCS